MPEGSGIATVAHIIQLAVAPVFLLSGIGAMLVVMTNRLARVVDRTRALEASLSIGMPAPAPVRSELSVLARRARLVSRSITPCSVTALLVCAAIATLFLGDLITFDVSFVVALLFLASMGTFFATDLIATASTPIGPR